MEIIAGVLVLIVGLALTFGSLFDGSRMFHTVDWVIGSVGFILILVGSLTLFGVL